VHITNVIFNLLDNAVKYSIDSPEIKITTENRNGELAISVQDKGIGIAKEHQSEIFDRFFRGSSFFLLIRRIYFKQVFHNIQYFNQ